MNVGNGKPLHELMAQMLGGMKLEEDDNVVGKHNTSIKIDKDVKAPVKEEREDIDTANIVKSAPTREDPNKPKEEEDNVDGIADGILVVTDPEITSEEFEEVADELQGIVDNAEGEVPFTDKYEGDYILSCPICGGTFVNDTLLDSGEDVCPICCKVPDAFVVNGRVENSEAAVDKEETQDDIEHEENLEEPAEGDLGTNTDIPEEPEENEEENPLRKESKQIGGSKLQESESITEDGIKYEFLDSDEDLGSDWEIIDALYKELGMEVDETWDNVFEDMDNGILKLATLPDGTVHFVYDNGTLKGYDLGRASDNIPVVVKGDIKDRVSKKENKLQEDEYSDYMEQEKRIAKDYKERIYKQITPEVKQAFLDLKDLLDEGGESVSVDGYYFPEAAVTVLEMADRTHHLNSYMNLTISNILNMVDDNDSVEEAIDELFEEYKSDSAFSWADNFISVLGRLDFDLHDEDEEDYYDDEELEEYDESYKVNAGELEKEYLTHVQNIMNLVSDDSLKIKEGGQLTVPSNDGEEEWLIGRLNDIKKECDGFIQYLSSKSVNENKKVTESRDRVAETLSKFIYDTFDDAWSGNQPTTMDGVKVYEVYKNGKSKFTLDDVKEAVLKKYPELKVYGSSKSSIFFCRKDNNRGKKQEYIEHGYAMNPLGENHFKSISELNDYIKNEGFEVLNGDEVEDNAWNFEIFDPAGWDGEVWYYDIVKSDAGEVLIVFDPKTSYNMTESKKVKTESNEDLKKKYSKTYDLWKKTNPQLTDKEILDIVKSKIYNGKINENKKVTEGKELDFTSEIEEAIVDCLTRIYEKNGAKSGDITPEQSIDWDDLISSLNKLFVELVKQNKPKNESKKVEAQDLKVDGFDDEAQRRINNRLSSLDIWFEKLAQATKDNDTDNITLNKSKIFGNIGYLIPALNIKGGANGLVDYLKTQDWWKPEYGELAKEIAEQYKKEYESKKVTEGEERLTGDETYVAVNSSGYKSIGLIVDNKGKQFQLINGQVMSTDSKTKKLSKTKIRQKAQELADKGYKEYKGYGSLAKGVEEGKKITEEDQSYKDMSTEDLQAYMTDIINKREGVPEEDTTTGEYLDNLYNAVDAEIQRRKQEESNKMEESNATTNGLKYGATSYYDDKCVGVDEDISTDNYDEVKDFVWKQVQNGDTVLVYNSETGETTKYCCKSDEQMETAEGIEDFLCEGKKVAEGKKVWSSEGEYVTDPEDEGFKDWLEANGYDEELESAEDEEERNKMLNDYMEWYNETDNEVISEDWEENVLPMIERQLDDEDLLILLGSAQTWRGTHSAGKVCRGIDEFSSLAADYDIIEFETNDNNDLSVDLVHHDGTHVMDLYTFNGDVEGIYNKLIELGINEFSNDQYEDFDDAYSYYDAGDFIDYLMDGYQEELKEFLVPIKWDV